MTSRRSGASRDSFAGAGSEWCGAGSGRKEGPRGEDGGMRQSGRVRCGGRGGGRHGRRGRRPPRSPLASRLRSPGTRSARAPRRSSAASRPTPRSRTRSCSLGAARVAAFGSSAWTYGGSWSRSPPPAFRSAPPQPSSTCPGPRCRGSNRSGLQPPWVEKETRMGTIVFASRGFSEQQ